jgi:hypothetical protein
LKPLQPSVLRQRSQHAFSDGTDAHGMRSAGVMGQLPCRRM